MIFGNGTWDLGHGIWELGPGTCDLGAGSPTKAERGGRRKEGGGRRDEGGRRREEGGGRRRTGGDERGKGIGASEPKASESVARPSVRPSVRRIALGFVGSQVPESNSEGFSLWSHVPGFRRPDP